MLRAKTAIAVGVLLIVVLGPRAALATETEIAEPPANCPNATLPPPPVDSSEVPPSGVPSPEPLPVPEEAVGGERMGACGVIVPSGSPAVPTEVTSSTWILAELDSGDVLAAKNPHGRHRPASVIKVLTALVAIRQLDMSETITVTQADAGKEGSKAGLVPGVTYTVRQVLTGLLLQSGNDAAHALARKLGGPDRTLTRMNRLARELGALDTRAATPSGLDGPGMSTSAYDMALIFRAALQEPAFAEIVARHHAEIPGRPDGPPLQLYNDNDVLRNYPGALGGKTGYTNDARHTYIAAAERDGHKLVAVLLRGENHPLPLSQQATALLDYGFRLGADAQAVGQLESPQPASSTSRAPQQQAGMAEKVDSSGPPEASGSSLFGTVGGPLALLVTALVAVLGAVGVRQRRAKLAATRRDSAELTDDEHP
ncbi:D-alanyl-D-alanine carboxypeptidase (penicillin-binding protein 5/6) [Halopolyspora algeriensis]|uniref:D-alanyl-D-alanine carboxypeptidase (Penicillin-binding protein 5/6) n=1 Tax=Halopolyspora algeriensis TaxID=1500506 RepID=A0A368VF29_9ACTN|nr:D-alanyl-D-alanine carboxypeptidase (penicillin-binding protein 5/6) [Halopolyspora algeriensis]TQM46654.1 D-alanyl-D-alanine carboxypeptidase (penicillin-binding protein 5/6) [Halopolyspora algeriensis]